MEKEIVNDFLDNVANMTLIDSALVTRLGLNGSCARLSVTTFNSTVETPSSYVSFELESINRKEIIQVDNAWSMDNILDLRLLTDSRISLLIEANIPKAHWVLDQRRAGSNEPYAIKSPLGGVILGPVSPTTKRTDESKENCIYSNREIRDSIEQMFNNKFNDTPSTRRAMSESVKEALNYMTSWMCLVNGHYQIALPWKSGATSLPDNRAQAYKRLMSIKRRLEINNSI